MVFVNHILAVFAQTRTQTGKTNQTSWELVVIAAILILFVLAAVYVRRGRRANNDPPAGSVPASEAAQRAERTP